MVNERKLHKLIDQKLSELSSVEQLESMRRYFPQGLTSIGVNAGNMRQVINSIKASYSELSADEYLSLSEYILANSQYHEEKLVAYALVQDLVKKNYSDALLERFKYWLEHYADNWALVDDLCIKTIYNFFLQRPHLIESTQEWCRSRNSWCRRGSNVVWVKFVHRKIGKSIYRLDTDLIFSNCKVLLSDSDIFVQKSIGWLLKSTSVHHQEKVAEFLIENIDSMPKSTLRYALEKVDIDLRQSVMSVSS